MCFPSAPPHESLYKMHRTHVLQKDVITVIITILRQCMASKNKEIMTELSL